MIQSVPTVLRSRVKNKLTMPHLGFVLLVLVALVNATSSNQISNKSGVSPIDPTKCHNMYAYNSFYVGASKEIKALLQEVKAELSEIREEIKSLKRNKTTGSYNQIYKSIIQFALNRGTG